MLHWPQIFIPLPSFPCQMHPRQKQHILLWVEVNCHNEVEAPEDILLPSQVHVVETRVQQFPGILL